MTEPNIVRTHRQCIDQGNPGTWAGPLPTRYWGRGQQNNYRGQYQGNHGQYNTSHVGYYNNNNYGNY